MVDYHMCNYTSSKDAWVSYEEGERTQYVYIPDGIIHRTCLYVNNYLIFIIYLAD